jgi:pimeloyl-ACP methyl ester carboxylesterase
MLETMRPIFAHEAWPEWRTLSAPTLLVLGQSSLISGDRVERMRAARPATRVVTIAHAGHDLHLEQPQAWLRARDAFLNVHCRRSCRSGSDDASHRAISLTRERPGPA